MLRCSSCTKEIVGIGAVLSDEADEEGFGHDTSQMYRGVLADREERWYHLLHPVCFVNLFEEITRQQREAAMFVAIADVSTIQDALEINN